MKILVIEDEPEIARAIELGLSAESFEVETAPRGKPGLQLALGGSYHLIILDIMLPDVDGIHVLQDLRAAGITAPVLLLTARNALDDKIGGLNSGADDYLTKPFFMEEFIARAHALLRRGSDVTNDCIETKGLTLNRVSRQCLVGTRAVDLTSREFRLLELILQTPGNIYTRSEILERIWDSHNTAATNIIDVYVHRLRSKLIVAGAPEDIIETVRGVGYRVGGLEKAEY